MTGFTASDLDALERPKRRARTRVGSAKDDDGTTERAIQRAIIKAGSALAIRCIAIPNGAFLNGDAAARMRQMAALRADGVVPGAPDLICIAKGGLTGWLEVKRPGQALRPEQIAFLKALELLGHRQAAVCSVDMALDTWRSWGWVK